MVKTDYAYIVKTANHRAGKARIVGTGVTVAGIVIMHQGGDSFETIAAAYRGLTMEKVREALDYYADNHEEIERDIFVMTHLPSGYREGPKGIIQKK